MDFPKMVQYVDSLTAPERSILSEIIHQADTIHDPIDRRRVQDALATFSSILLKDNLQTRQRASQRRRAAHPSIGVSPTPQDVDTAPWQTRQAEASTPSSGMPWKLKHNDVTAERNSSSRQPSKQRRGQHDIEVGSARQHNILCPSGTLSCNPKR